jgi:hypothetical protein
MEIDGRKIIIKRFFFRGGYEFWIEGVPHKMRLLTFDKATVVSTIKAIIKELRPLDEIRARQAQNPSSRLRRNIL